MRKALVVLAALALPGVAQAMTVAEFLGRVDAIKANPFTYFSNVGPLKAEGAAAANAWRAQVAPPGRRPNACPTAGPQKMSNGEFLAMMQAVPPAHRATTSVTEATIAGLNRRYPCKG